MYSVVHLTLCQESLPKQVLHRIQSSASSFDFHYPLFSLKSSTSCLRLLPRLPVSSILSSVFLRATCLRRQFLRKMWQIQLIFLSLLYVRYSSPPWLFVLHFSHDRSRWSSPSFLILHNSKLSRYFWSIFQSVQIKLWISV